MWAQISSPEAISDPAHFLRYQAWTVEESVSEMNSHGGQLTSHGWRAAPHALVLAPVTHPAASRVGAHVAPDGGFFLAIWPLSYSAVLH